MHKALLNFLIIFAFGLIISPVVFWFVRKIKGGQNILEYVENHKSKQGTLSLGGLIFIIGACVAFFIFSDSNKRLSSVMLLTILAFGLLGFLDDIIKIKYKHNEGLKPYQKFIGQVGIGLILGIFIYNSALVGSIIELPFLGISIDIGIFIIPFVCIFFVAVVNSVNLIDGLDGLSGGVGFVVIIGISIIIGITTNFFDSNGGNAVLIEEYKNMITFAGGFAGGLLAFLVFNSHPAKIFMGDTGSLALGGIIACLFAFSKQYLLIIIIGFMFVITSLSDILQVFYYKLTKKRIFKMAPLHHHFEKIGCNETKICAIYIIITIVLTVFSIAMVLI